MLASGLNLTLILNLLLKNRIVPLFRPSLFLPVHQITIPAVKRKRTKRRPQWTFPWESLYNKAQKEWAKRAKGNPDEKGRL